MARARKRKKGVDDAEVPMSAMIDVVFLLLIYFIVTQKPIIEDTLLPCDLPSPGQSPPKDEKPTLFTIDVARFFAEPEKDEYIYGFNQRPVKYDYLRDVLLETGKNDPEQTIIINCDPNAIHRKLIRILDTCQEAGLTKLNLVEDATIGFKPFTYSTD